MGDFKVYLAGSMCGISFEEQSKWRRQIRDAITYGGYDYEKKPYFFNPVNYYNFQEVKYKSELEVMEFDLYNLRKSDLVIVNFNNVNSIGTAMELAIAHELKIPVIGWNSSGEELHPWIKNCVSRLCENIQEVVEYVVEFYLN